MPRHGLLVGVDVYPHFPECNQLASCVRDAELMAQVLVDRFDFRPENLRLLYNSEATRERILAALGDLVKRSESGDQVVFFFSGHGSRMTDDRRPSGWSETLVPFDSGWPSFDPQSENRDIRDDELYRWLLELSEITPYVTVIFDSCKAGGALRDDPAGAPRKGVPGRAAPARRSQVALRGESSTFRDTGPSGWLPLSERYALLAACRANESAFILDLPDGAKQSAFTFFLAQEMRRLSEPTTYRDLGERLQPLVSALYPRQTPQVEGARDRVLFGVETLAPRPYLPVRRQEGHTVWLGGGAVHGVQPRSRWALHPPGTRRAEGSRALAHLTVTTVHATEAEGQLAETTSELPDGCRGFEVERRLALTLPVILEEDEGEAVEAVSAEKRQALRRQLEASDLLDLLEAERPTGPAWTVRAAREAAASAWEILGTTGEAVVAPVREPEAVVKVLEAFARHRHVLTLEPPAVTPPLRDALEVELLRRRPAGAEASGGWHTAEAEADGPPVFHEGDELALRIHNRLQVPLYLHVLDLGLTGAVTLIHPVPGEHLALPGGRTEEVGLRSGEELVVGLPEDFVGEEGLEWLKIFATTQEADLSFLESGAPRLRTGEDRSPLELLVGAAWMADSLREKVTQEAVADSWLAMRVAFRVRR